MIRRDVFDQDTVSHWILISQVEHARISAELATQWGNDEQVPTICPEGAPLATVRREVLTTVRHHDDGWRDWSGHPDLDSDGRPRAFTEMPLDQALPIWSDSIAVARAIGPLGGWMVAGHFSALLESSERCHQEAAQAWLTAQQQRRVQWLDEWLAFEPERHTQLLATAALRWLQLFDAMSLWICIEAPTGDERPPHDSPYRLTLPDDSTVSLRVVRPAPGRSPSQDRETVIATIDPWPFRREQLTVEASGAAVVARSYQSTEQLIEQRRALRLRWRLARHVLDDP